MREVARLAATLAAVCALAGAAIAAVHGAVTPTIDEHNRREAASKRRQVFPAAQQFEARTVAGREIFVAKDAAGIPLGLVVTAAPRGYVGPIGMTLGIAADGTIAGLAISRLDLSETPGLGVKVTLAAFRDQFRGAGADAARLKLDGGAVDAVSAATISSRAVANGARDALLWYREHFPQGIGGERRGG